MIVKVSLFNLINMADERYNGWANYDTWGMSLLIDNDEGLSEEFREHVELLKNKEESLSDTMDWMKDWAYEWMGYEDLDSNQQQFMGSSLSNVDYREIIMNEANLKFEDLN